MKRRDIRIAYSGGYSRSRRKCYLCSNTSVLCYRPSELSRRHPSPPSSSGYVIKRAWLPSKGVSSRQVATELQAGMAWYNDLGRSPVQRNAIFFADTASQSRRPSIRQSYIRNRQTVILAVKQSCEQACSVDNSVPSGGDAKRMRELKGCQVDVDNCKGKKLAQTIANRAKPSLKNSQSRGLSSLRATLARRKEKMTSPSQSRLTIWPIS